MAAPAYQVIGTRPLRPDGIDKVTGRAVYGADVKLPGTLHGKIVRSPHAHAAIVAIDTAAAAALPGVRAVVTAADLPQIGDQVAGVGEGAVNLRYMSSNILAHDKVLYYGHAVAAVAADNVHVAEEAAQLIRIEYAVLPHVLDARQAMAPGAPILLDDVRTEEMGRRSAEPTNVTEHLSLARGDLAAGFARAAVVVEGQFHTATVHQGYIEPHSATVLWSEDGRVQIWCSTQGAWGVQEQVAAILRLPVSAVQVTPTEIGGGFGGKNSVYLEPVAALLSLRSGHRPVKMTMTRAEVLAGTGPTSGSYVYVKLGADSSGRLTAAQAEIIFEAGAFPGSFLGTGCGAVFAAYRLENLQIDGYEVVVNRPKAAAYRAPGATNVIFASETLIDELAERLNLDPIELRLCNAAQEGDRRPEGPVYPRIGVVETLTVLREHPHYTAPLGGRRRGRGVAGSLWFNWGGKSSAAAAVNADGTVSLIEGSVDIGGTRASLAMQLAETLGIAYEDVRPQVVGTAGVGYNEGTYGSRTTFSTGWAVYELGKKITAEMRQAAAEIWDVAPAAVEVERGAFRHGGRRLTFKELAAQLERPVTASASVYPPAYGPTYAAHIVDVEVDPDTGKVTILRYTAAQDVGTAIHPAYVEGQLQGGAAQGVGWALNEEYIYDDRGRLLNASLLDYRMPTALDLPMIDTVLVEVPNPGHPYGVRGAGEAPIVPPAAAVANAIYHATGVRMRELPMTPARLVQALGEQQQ